MPKWRHLQFKVNSECQIFEKPFHGNFHFLSKFLPEICWEEAAEGIFSYFRFIVWPGGLNHGLTSKKRTHYLLNYGDIDFSWKLRASNLHWKISFSNEALILTKKNCRLCTDTTVHPETVTWVHISLRGTWATRPLDDIDSDLQKDDVMCHTAYATLSILH